MSRNNHLGTLMWRRLFKRFEARDSSLQTRLHDTLMHAVLEGIVAPNDMVPSSRWFAESLGISRTTSSLVLRRLCDAGILVARPRSGYHVKFEAGGSHVMPEAVGPHAQRAAASFQPVPGTQRRAPASREPPAWVARIGSPFAQQRNIAKPHDWQRYDFPFIYGQFDATVFPFSEWRECALETLRKGEVTRWAPDHIDRDSPALIDQIRRRLLPARGIWAEDDTILVTAGAQQAIFMLANLLLHRATPVGIENPGFADARNSFALHSRNVRPLPVDAGGLIVDAALDRCRYIYVTPSHQCPTTVTMTLERRLALLERAERNDVVIIEDDHESELNHIGTPTPALKSLDSGERVIYIGSLSKTLAHGLRIGYIVAPAPLIRELRALRRLMLRHPATNNEHTAAVFIQHGFHEAFVRRLNRNYHERAGVLSAAMQRHLPDASYAQANGGSALWVRVSERIDTEVLAREALRHGVVIEPGEVFFGGEHRPRNFMRMGYSSIEAGRIDEGVGVLAKLAKAML